MADEAIEELGQLLVTLVRDETVAACNEVLAPGEKHPRAVRWRKETKPGAEGPPPKVVIPDVVDMTIATLMRMIDRGLIKLSFTDSKGDTIDLEEDGNGELSGLYTAFWRQKYSKQRFVDDFANIELDTLKQ